MRGYRVFIIDAQGRIKDRLEFFCHNHDEAKERAKQLVDGHAVELWEEGRKIANFEPESLQVECTSTGSRESHICSDE